MGAAILDKRRVWAGFSFSFSLYFYCLCLSILPARVSVHHIYVVIIEAIKECHIPWGKELQTVMSHCVGSGSRTRVLRKSSQCLTTELSLQPQALVVLTFLAHFSLSCLPNSSFFPLPVSSKHMIVSISLLTLLSCFPNCHKPSVKMLAVQRHVSFFSVTISCSMSPSHSLIKNRID